MHKSSEITELRSYEYWSFSTPKLLNSRTPKLNALFVNHGGLVV